MTFTTFKKELSDHRYGGYHHTNGPLQRSDVCSWFRARALKPPSEYVDFLCAVGPGIFFGGALTIYPLSSDRWRSVESELSRLRKMSSDEIFPFGYDGTTESCFCLESTSGKNEVYWFSWEEKIKRSFSTHLPDWIEAKPSELFEEKVYAAYKKLTNVDELVAVMDERAAFTVRLVGFDKQLQIPPDKPNDMLPRYNKLVLEVTKGRPVTIPVLTVVVERLGSQIGAANVEYVTFPVHDVPVNMPTIRECYVFDPFNVPFTDIKVKFNPVIDLGSKMRVRFKELSALL